MNTRVQRTKVRTHVERGPIPYTVSCLSPHEGSWSLKHLQTQADANDNPQLMARLDTEFVKRGITHAYAPAVAHFSGAMAFRADLTDEIFLPSGTRLYRNQALPRDGILDLTEPTSALIISNIGCPTVIVSADGFLMGAHAGRESSIDKIGRVLKEGPAREHESIVQAMIHYLRSQGVGRFGISVRVTFSIPPFPHPQTKGGYYEKFIPYVQSVWEPHNDSRNPIVSNVDGVPHLNMYLLLRAQALSCGVTDVKCEQLLSLDGNHSVTRHVDREFAKLSNLTILQAR